MIKKYSIIILLISSCVGKTKENVVTEIVTESMVAEQEKLCVSKYEIEKREKEITSFIDTMSVKEIKKHLHNNFDYYVNNKSSIIKALKANQKNEDDKFKSESKLYLPSEEKYKDKENIYLKLVNNNHSNYKDTVQKGSYFNQLFKNNKSFLKTRVRNNGATIYKFKTEETVSPHYFLNFDSEKELRIMNIYYHDGTINNTPTPIESHSFPLNSIPVGNMKHVDSLQLEFKIKYVSKIDSIHFKKDEIGVQKGDYKLLKMENNYVEYEIPNDYYPYHKGTILEEAYFNKEGKVLETRFTIGNCYTNTPEEDYKERLNYNKNVFEYIKNLETKEQLFLTLKYLSLKYFNTIRKEIRKNRVTLQGNIDSFTLYIENRRDTISFLATLKNSSPLKNMYLHELENETAFINKNGKLITSIPSSINFLYLLKTSTYSDRYFYTYDKKEDTRVYYFLNEEKQIIEQLPYSKMQYICPSILGVEEKDKEGFQLLSTENNVLLSDKTFTRFLIMRYTDVGILMYSKDGNYILYDQNNQLITEETQVVKKIILKETSY